MERSARLDVYCAATMGSTLRISATQSFAALALSAGLAGCSTPIASGLEEPEANRVMYALDRAQIASSKEVDGANEGRFRVLISPEDASKALSAMRAEELPRRKPQSAADANRGGLVPSPQAEQAQLAQGIAGELERSLESVDGVLSARVHLSLPTADPLRDAPRDRATASVLIAHRGSTPPLAEAAVQRLVAGGAPGLTVSEVAVVMVPRAAPADRADDAGMARLGPFGVARASLRPIQFTIAGLLVLLAALAGALVVLGSRLSRAAAAGEAERAKAR